MLQTIKVTGSIFLKGPKYPRSRFSEGRQAFCSWGKMNRIFFLSKRKKKKLDSRVKGTYLQGTADELQFLQSGRSYDWRFHAHNLPEQCLPRRSGFCFSSPMTKANQTPPGSENPVRMLGSSGPAEETQTIFPPSTSSPQCRTGSCNHLATETPLLGSSLC